MQPIVVEKLLRAPIEKVWKALTDKNEMKQWYFDLAEFRAEKGFTFTFTGGPSPEKQYLHVCNITEATQPDKLAYTWRYEGYEGLSKVTFDLEKKGSDTLLRLTHEGLETFPASNPDFAASNFELGWDDIINRSLPEYLEKQNHKA